MKDRKSKIEYMEQRQTYLITVHTEELLPGISEKLETLLINTYEIF